MIEIQKPNWIPRVLLSAVNLCPEIRYIPSQYAVPFEHKGRQCVFHNLTKQCIEGSLPETARAGEGYDDLIMARFLVPEDLDECDYYNHVSALVRAGSKVEGIRCYTILPTLGCNARCVYCYEEGWKQTTMTPETADQVIRFITATHTDYLTKLVWFGGEPLLCENIIDRISEGVRDAGIEFFSSMISNGSLITPDIIQKMARDWELKEIQISMDGAEQDYIARKRYIADQDYYHMVFESISRLSEAGIKVTVSCNVDEENWSRVPQFLKDLSEDVTNKENVDVCLSPLFAVRRGEEDVSMWKKIMDARTLIEDAGIANKPSMNTFQSFPAYRCKFAAGGVGIWPDGSLRTCANLAPDISYGDIWQGVTDEETRKELCRVDQTREKCRTCPYLPNCTSFVCPVEDTHCREVMGLWMQEFLKERFGRD